jgi:hypothetical protein
MDQKIVLAAVGIVLAASVVFLIAKLLKSEKPPCEFKTIEIKLEEPENGGKEALVVVPDDLKEVKECALIIFTNQTQYKVTIKFLSSNTTSKTPFSGVDTFSLAKNEEQSEFSKGFPVAVKLPNDSTEFEFEYEVTADGPPETEQSPRIRIGPRTTTARD